MTHYLENELLKIFIFINLFFKFNFSTHISVAIFSEPHFSFEFCLFLPFPVETIGQKHLFSFQSCNFSFEPIDVVCFVVMTSNQNLTFLKLLKLFFKLNVIDTALFKPTLEFFLSLNHLIGVVLESFDLLFEAIIFIRVLFQSFFLFYQSFMASF